MNHRRRFFRTVFGFGAGAAALAQAAKGQHAHSGPANSGAPIPVVTPDIEDLPFTMENGVKVFHLIAEPVKQTVIPGRVFDLWGFNGSAPGPTIQASEGDRVRIVFENHLPEPTGIHWHGLELPNEMDGVPGIGQKPVMPGERFVYEFPLQQNGTFFYHPHMAMQEMVGMLGGFIIHPKTGYSPRVDKDYLIALQEYAVLPNSTIPNSMNMEFNWLTFNGKAGPAATPLIIRHGERVRVRIINLGMDHHPIHLHGNQFVITGTEGGRAPESTWYPTNTVLVGVAQAKVVEFEAKYPGAWMIHCHLPHHMMNSMMDLLRDRQIQTADTTDPKALSQMQTLARAIGVEHVHHSPIAENANGVPGFPQDAFMEMGMDEAVAKPETYGLPPNWSAGMMGMMTMVRVLPEKEFEEIQARIREKKPMPQTEHVHPS